MLERIERFGLVELLIVWIRPRAHHVGDKFLRPSFSQQSLPELIAAHSDSHNLDIRKLFLKIRQHCFVTADVDDNLTFPLGRFESLFPLLVPGGVCLSGIGKFCKANKNRQQNVYQQHHQTLQFR